MSGRLEIDCGEYEGDSVREPYSVKIDCAVADITDLDEFKISTIEEAWDGKAGAFAGFQCIGWHRIVVDFGDT